MDTRQIFLLILGWLGTTLSLTYRLPQIYKLYKTKSGEDVSKRAIYIQSSSYIVWTIYSILRNDNFYIYSNILSFLQNIIIWVMKYRYKTTPREATPSAVTTTI